MPRRKLGIISKVEQALGQILKTNEKLSETTKSLEKRLTKLEQILTGAPAKRRKLKRKARGKRGRKVKKVVKICSFPGCKKPARAKGLCANHYQKMRREKKV